MHRNRSLERLRARIGSALDLCSQLESGRQNFANRVRDMHATRDDVNIGTKNVWSGHQNRCEAPTAGATPSMPTVPALRPESSLMRRQTDEAHIFQPAKQDNNICPKHRGRLLPNGTSEPFRPPSSMPTNPLLEHVSFQMNEANENTNYGWINSSRPCPFSPTRACPRQGPCPYATSLYTSTGTFDNTRRPCPYSPTNYCARGGPCPYMPTPPPPPPVDDMVCPFVARMADAMNYHSQVSPAPPPPMSSCYRCSSPPPDNRCYSPTVCPLDPRPCVLSPRPCPFKQPESQASQFALGCPYASGISSSRHRTYSEPRRCPYAL